MGENQVGVILPLKIKEEVIGYIILGEKKSGDAFTSEDVSVLETFALQAAIGIENILLFMSTKDFNKQLKSEVDRATSQLQAKNRTLELLRKMDAIITQTLDLEVLSQQIVETLSWELGYDVVCLNIFDKKKNNLVTIAWAHSPVADKVAALVTGYEKQFEVSLRDYKHPLVKVFSSGVTYSSTHLHDVISPKVAPEIINQLEKMHDVKGVLAFPVYAKERVVGVLVVGFSVKPEQLSESERGLLGEFVKEVGIALDNAMLYEELKVANQKLKDTNQKLIELDQMKDEFISIVSHELRTPMTVINSYVWMALHKGGDLPPKAIEYLDKVPISARRMINLVEDMLSVSRIESGRVQIEVSDFEMCALVKDVQDELRIKASERTISMELDTQDCKAHVMADMSKVREVITNLIANAIKFTEIGGRVCCEILIKGDFVEVAVNDNGRGWRGRIYQNCLPSLVG